MAQDPSLISLLSRNDIPQDARDVIAAKLQDMPLQTDKWIYRSVVIILGLTVLATVFGGLVLIVIGQGQAAWKLPDALVAIGSAAVGALAGLLAPSPISAK